MKKLIIATLSLILGYSSISAQEKNQLVNDDQVIVYLKSGSSIEGVVLEWALGEYIELKTAWSSSFVLPDSSIEKVIQKSTLGIKENHAYRFKEQGLYYSVKNQVISGNAGGRANYVFGHGLSASAGVRYSRWYSVGMGLGYDTYIFNSGENLFPLFLETTTFYNRKNTSLFTHVQAGYSFAFKNSEYGISDAKGGLMLYPAVGLRFGRYDTKFTLDLGYKFQKAQFTYLDAWNSDRHEQRLLYKRLTLRFGILL